MNRNEDFTNDTYESNFNDFGPPVSKFGWKDDSPPLYQRRKDLHQQPRPGNNIWSSGHPRQQWKPPAREMISYSDFSPTAATDELAKQPPTSPKNKDRLGAAASALAEPPLSENDLQSLLSVPDESSSPKLDENMDIERLESLRMEIVNEISSLHEDAKKPVGKGVEKKPDEAKAAKVGRNLVSSSAYAAKPKVPRVVKEADNVFGSLLSSLDGKIMEKKKKEARKPDAAKEKKEATKERDLIKITFKSFNAKDKMTGDEQKPKSKTKPDEKPKAPSRPKTDEKNSAVGRFVKERSRSTSIDSKDGSGSKKKHHSTESKNKDEKPKADRKEKTDEKKPKDPAGHSKAATSKPQDDAPSSKRSFDGLKRVASLDSPKEGDEQNEEEIDRLIYEKVKMFSAGPRKDANGREAKFVNTGRISDKYPHKRKTSTDSRTSDPKTPEPPAAPVPNPMDPRLKNVFRPKAPEANRIPGLGSPVENFDAVPPGEPAANEPSHGPRNQIWIRGSQEFQNPFQNYPNQNEFRRDNFQNPGNIFQRPRDGFQFPGDYQAYQDEPNRNDQYDLSKIGPIDYYDHVHEKPVHNPMVSPNSQPFHNSPMLNPNINRHAVPQQFPNQFPGASSTFPGPKPFAGPNQGPFPVPNQGAFLGPNQGPYQGQFQGSFPRAVPPQISPHHGSMMQKLPLLPLLPLPNRSSKHDFEPDYNKSHWPGRGGFRSNFRPAEQSYRAHRLANELRDDRDPRTEHRSERDSRRTDRDPRGRAYRYDRNDSTEDKKSPVEEKPSPLTSLYVDEPKKQIGKGYGMQKFKIPKLKRESDEVKDEPKEEVKEEREPEKEVEAEKEPEEKPEQEKEKEQERRPDESEIISKFITSLIEQKTTSVFYHVLEKLEETLPKFKYKRIRRVVESDSEDDSVKDEAGEREEKQDGAVEEAKEEEVKVTGRSSFGTVSRRWLGIYFATSKVE